MTLAIAVVKKLVFKQLYIKTAFLYSFLLKEEIYMKQPIGYEDKSTEVYKLQRGLYRLQQAP